MTLSVFNWTTGTTFDTNAGNKTGAFGAAVQVGDLMVAFVAASGQTGTFGGTDDSSDGHGTYTKLCDVVSNGSTNQMTVLIRNRFFGTATTPNFSTTGLSGNTGGGFMLALIRGLGAGGEGSACVRQWAKTDNVLANALGVVQLNRPVSNSTALLGGFIADQNATTGNPPTGFSSFIAQTYITPNQEIRPCSVSQPAVTGSTFAWAAALTVTSCYFLMEVTSNGPAPDLNSDYVTDFTGFPKQLMNGYMGG